jgi:hypothetical protein
VIALIHQSTAGPVDSKIEVKEYLVFIRGVLRLKTSLKEALKPVAMANGLNTSIWVDEVVLKSLRYPSLPLPLNANEGLQLLTMHQGAHVTCYQKYLYAIYGASHSTKKTKDTSAASVGVNISTT